MTLTKRQEQIVVLIEQGLSRAEIAARLETTAWSVRSDVRRMCKAYDCLQYELPEVIARGDIART